MARTIEFTPYLGGSSLIVRKPDVWEDGNPGYVQLTWLNPMRHELDALRAWVAKEVLQVRNRDGFVRVVVSPGTELLRLLTDESYRAGGARVIDLIGVLQFASAQVNQGVDQLTMLFWLADDMYVSGTGEVVRTTPTPTPPPGSPV